MKTESKDCELCKAAKITKRYHEDEVCWIADCEVCRVPMVVWRHHGTEPPEAQIEYMLSRLAEVATKVFGSEGFKLDTVMRQIPNHFHAHARVVVQPGGDNADFNVWLPRQRAWKIL